MVSLAKLITGAVALLLPWLIGALAAARQVLGLPPDPAAKLALFLPNFNPLGVLLMWPLAGAPRDALARDQAIVNGLDRAVESFVERMNRAAMSQQVSERLAELLRIERQHESSAEQAAAAMPLHVSASDDPALAARHGDFVAQTDALMARCDAVASRQAVPNEAAQVGAAAADAASHGLMAV